MSLTLHRLTVADARPEIGGEAKSIEFDIPPALGAEFTWKAGQHVTISIRLKGREYRRSYSITNPPGESLRVTVKRVRNGMVSNHLVDRLQTGDRVDVTRPYGEFVLRPAPQGRRTHYFFGAGSGITPLYAMARTVLRDEPFSYAHLILGNTDRQRILFYEEAQRLHRRHANRCTVRHILSSPRFLDGAVSWRKGRIDLGALKSLFSETPPVAQDVHYWICGPASMNDDLSRALGMLDVPGSRIHSESYGYATPHAIDAAGVDSTGSVTLDGHRTTLAVSARQTFLQAARQAGLQPPFSCESGVCGACRARLHSGDVHHRRQMALDERDVARGYVLTCQAVPASPAFDLTYDV
ncbi:ferredoxin--NADP reductase [Streptomyces sp. HNM0663]|uniref:Ferredoxin--NADP reductase n=1 Tax=Streptomyces chengmaiensis TaxID=3040919 RepID=A0ABT6HM23_9ACTN|nr:ferredoxin--NADP reductase [Streptomyces chengmaiensis]MDH2389660.1 ferredoxin--NADP reductase [Streptomyces chengmaiensis]